MSVVELSLENRRRELSKFCEVRIQCAVLRLSEWLECHVPVSQPHFEQPLQNPLHTHIALQYTQVAILLPFRHHDLCELRSNQGVKGYQA
jgi:hypothetical protein